MVMKANLTRRSLLGVGAGTLLGGFGADAWALRTVRTPFQPEGPFYPVSWAADTGADLIGLTTGNVLASGTPLALNGRVHDRSRAPLAGLRIEIWQCDHRGIYRHPGDHGRGEVDAGFQGFGAAMTGNRGEYQFFTIVPVPYTGRPPHIHVKLKRGGQELLTTQLYLEGDPMNGRDGLLSFLRPRSRAALMMSLDEASLPGRISGMAAKFDFVV